MGKTVSARQVREFIGELEVMILDFANEEQARVYDDILERYQFHLDKSGYCLEEGT